MKKERKNALKLPPDVLLNYNSNMLNRLLFFLHA